MLETHEDEEALESLNEINRTHPNHPLVLRMLREGYERTRDEEALHYLIPAGVVLLVLFFRLRSVGKARRLRLERLWILPTFYALLLGFVFWNAPPHGLVWIWCLVALAVGSGLGCMRGKLMQVDTPQNLYDFPDNIFVATFIGSPQMNMLRGRYSAAAGTITVGSGVLHVPAAVSSARPSPFIARFLPVMAAGKRPSIRRK